MPYIKNKKLFNYLILCISIILFSIASLFIIRSFNEKKEENLNQNPLIIFASPSVIDQISEIAKEYTLRSGSRISLNFLPEKQLNHALSELDSPLDSVAFVGYELNEANMESAISIGKQQIIGIENTNQSDFQIGSSVVFKNICQLEKVAKAKGIPLMLSINSTTIKENIEEGYKQDCASLCNELVNRITPLTDISTVDFLIENRSDYALVSQNIISKLLSDHNFSYEESAGYFFYFDKDMHKKYSSQDSYKIIEIVSDNNLSIIPENPIEIKEIKDNFYELCKKEITSNTIISKNIYPKSFSKSNGILLGMKRDIQDFGVKVYQSNKKANIWFVCHNVENKECSDMVRFLGTNKAKSLLKKYK